MNTTYLKIKSELDMEGVVTRYKDYVAVAKYILGPCGDFFEAQLWQPIETEEETGEDFYNLRLENASEWQGVRFETEGEALAAVYAEIERRLTPQPRVEVVAVVTCHGVVESIHATKPDLKAVVVDCDGWNVFPANLPPHKIY